MASGATETRQTRVYTLDEQEFGDWVADTDGEDRAFVKRSLTTGEPAGTRVEIYGPDRRLLEAFTVS